MADNQEIKGLIKLSCNAELMINDILIITVIGIDFLSYVTH
jgi:hypothetical protein